MDRLVITAARRRRLEHQLRSTSDTRVYRRTLAVLEVARGRPVAAVARSLGVTRQVVHIWLAAYARDLDPHALADAPRPGRPPVGTPDLRDRLRAALAQPPDRLGYRATDWTVPLLREHLAGRAGVRPSAAALRRWLHDLGFAWKRARYVLPPDPEREKKTRPPAAGARPAGPHRPAGRGRDRPAAVPAAAGRLGGAGATGPGADHRGQRQAGAVRGDEPADRHPGVAGRPLRPRGRLPVVPGPGPRPLPGPGGGPAAGRGLVPHRRRVAAGGRRPGDRVAVAADPEPAPEPDGPPVAARQAGGLRQPAVPDDRRGGPSVPLVSGGPDCRPSPQQGRRVRR